MIIISKLISYNGMALWPFIILREERFRHIPVLINHERIHLRQQKELLVLPFYVLYLLNYLVNLLIYHHHDTAYRNIIFEREAYANDRDLQYLKQRKWLSVFRYWRKSL
jgi:hypothetical protein